MLEQAKEMLMLAKQEVHSAQYAKIKKLKYDKEHEHELTMYENTRADLKTLLAEGEKITPKAGKD